jgi:hypothetical protein
VPGQLYCADPGHEHLVLVIATTPDEGDGYVVATTLESVWHGPWTLYVEDANEPNAFVRLT